MGCPRPGPRGRDALVTQHHRTARLDQRESTDRLTDGKKGSEPDEIPVPGAWEQCQREGGRERSEGRDPGDVCSEE